MTFSVQPWLISHILVMSAETTVFLHFDNLHWYKSPILLLDSFYKHNDSRTIMYVTQNDMLHSIYGSNRVWYVTHCSSRWLALDSVIAKYTLSVLPRPLDILVSGFNGDSNNCINISEIFSIPKDFFHHYSFILFSFKQNILFWY